MNTTNCAPGFYCSGARGTCFADCDARTGDGCGMDQGCTVEGRCIDVETAGDARVVVPSGDGGNPFVCAEVELDTSRATPNVVVVFDQSASMNQGFSGGSRWDVLRESLLDDEGLIRDLQGLSCVIELRGRVEPDMGCAGRVELNGVEFVCDDPNGWEVIDESHIELRGEACERLQNGMAAELNATFPCDIVLI